MYEKIKKESLGTKLEPYTEHGLRSFNSELKIIGEIRLDRCLMSADFEIKDAVCLVTHQLSGKTCILRRDWSLKIPRLARTLHNMTKTVKEMSDSIREKVHEFQTVLRTNIN